MSSVTNVRLSQPDYFKEKTATSQKILLAIGIIVILGSTVFAALSIWQLNVEMAANLSQTISYIELATSGLAFVTGAALTFYALQKKQEAQNKLEASIAEQQVEVAYPSDGPILAQDNLSKLIEKLERLARNIEDQESSRVEKTSTDESSESERDEDSSLSQVSDRLDELVEKMSLLAKMLESQKIADLKEKSLPKEVPEVKQVSAIHIFQFRAICHLIQKVDALAKMQEMSDQIAAETKEKVDELSRNFARKETLPKLFKKDNFPDQSSIQAGSFVRINKYLAIKYGMDENHKWLIIARDWIEVKATPLLSDKQYDKVLNYLRIKGYLPELAN